MTQSPQESAEVRAREVLQREIEAEGADFARAHSVRREATAGFTLRLEGVAIRAMLAFAHQSPSRAAGLDGLLAQISYSERLELLAKLSGEKSIATGHADTEGEAAEMFAHLNCPACGGSGHVDDATPHPVTGNDELTGRERALRAAFIEGLQSGWQSGAGGEKLDARYIEQSWLASDAIHSLATPQTVPANAELPGREHRFGSPPEPVVNPNQAWCDAYADWYYQGKS